MAVDERARHELYQPAEAAMSRSGADTLMSLLPPVGWADVATKHDLAELEQRMDLRFAAITSEIRTATSDIRASMRGDLLRMTGALLGFVVALVVPLVTLT